MTTAARPTIDSKAHWYHKDGTPCFEVLAKGTGKPRPTTLRDARELGLLPSVTTLLKLLARPDLETWKMEQFGLALLTAPRLPDEMLDSFVHRVIHEEQQHKQEAASAADLGKDIHGSLADCLSVSLFHSNSPRISPYINPVLDFLNDRKVIACEQIVVGNGYAGTCDLLTHHQEPSPIGGTVRLCENYVDLWDFKSTKRLPDKSYPEHRLQLSAYAEAIEEGAEGTCVCDTYNVYISTTEPGQFKVYRNPSWIRDFNDGFSPILQYWQWLNQYSPEKEA